MAGNAGKVNAVMLQNLQSIDVRTPVDSVPMVSFQEKNSHHTTGSLRDIPQERSETFTNLTRSLLLEASIPTFTIGPERKKRVSIGANLLATRLAGIEYSKCDIT